MTGFEISEILGKAFAYGEVDILGMHLAEDCVYISEYANNRFDSAEKIIERLKYVHANLKEKNRYTYSVIKLDDFADVEKLQSEDGFSDTLINECGLCLYQHGRKSPVSVVIIALNSKGEICRIVLSRNKNIFNIRFYGEPAGKDSPYDLPSTVTPLTRHDRQVKELQDKFSGQHLEDIPEEEKDNFYIWRQADVFIKDWLKSNGYYVLESQIQDDCIGYRCNRNNYAYTVYMYAYGQKRTSQIDGEYCKKLRNLPFSENSMVLVVYLNVKRFYNGDDIGYSVCCYSGNDEGSIELWQLIEVDGKIVLNFFPRKEMIDRTQEFMYAFNHDSLDVYDCIVAEHNPEFNGYDERGIFFNDAFYSSLKNLHDKYGDMKIGFARFNDVVYSLVPYLEGYGFFGFSVDSDNNDRINNIYSLPFEGGERPCTEFIRMQETADEDMYSHYPKIVEAVPLEPVETERFALKLTFDNGETKKYVLPIDRKTENDEAIGYRNHVFTDKIWQSVKIASSLESEYRSYPLRGQSLVFKNGFFISSYLCYEKSTFYSEPVECSEIVYEDDNIRINRILRWNVKGLYEDEETGLLHTMVSGQAFNYHGISTYASRDGKRITSLDFVFSDNFAEGLALVGVAGRGYGFIDESGKFVIPPIYENAEGFRNGKAVVVRNGKQLLIDKNGNETDVFNSEKYQDVREFSEGLCRVSTLKLDFMDLAYHTDYPELAGVWGYINENGDEVIAPQYIYADDFTDGIAVVCKGKWTIDKKWDNEYNTGKYWTEEELWGAIDKNGNEIIPCIYDEIKYFNDTTEVFMAHYGGWKNGKWCVVSKTGEQLTETIFEDLDYVFKDGLFAFYQNDKWSEPDNVPLGVYDLKQNKVIFEPQFLDVNFTDDGNLEVEVFDEKLGRTVEKIIDLNGNEIFPSVYSSIYTWQDPYEVAIRYDDTSKHGLIDKNGTVLLPCKYDVAWNGISYEKRRIIVRNGEKQSLIDFDENVIIPEKYYEIYGLHNPLLTVRDGEKDNYKEGLVTLDGTVAVPAEYERIYWGNDNRLLCSKEGISEILEITVK